MARKDHMRSWNQRWSGGKMFSARSVFLQLGTFWHNGTRQYRARFSFDK